MAELQQPQICHPEQDKASSAAWLCLLGGCGAHPHLGAPQHQWQDKTGLEGGSWAQEVRTANPCL